jgi:hypothetical protein
MMARISEARALEYRFLTASSGFFRRMFWIVGRRKPRVLPVPVRACATLDESQNETLTNCGTINSHIGTL